MKETEIRNKNGSFKDVAMELDKAVTRVLKPIYDIYQKKLHPDNIHLIISSNSNLQSIMIVALNSFED